MRNSVSTTPPLPGATLAAQINELAQTLGTDFAGATDPASMAWAYSSWADTGNNVRKRRNAANSAWIVEAILFQQAHPQYSTGSIPTIDVGPIYVATIGDMEWDVTSGAYVPVDRQIQSMGAAFASSAMTVTYAGGILDFPSATQNGTPVRLTVGAGSITAPSGASFGIPNGQPGQIALLEAYNAGSPVLCLANLAGGLDLSEINLISPTTISSGATASNVIYSASAVAANSPYRVLGVVKVPAQTTSGVYTTGTPTAFGTGGMAYAAIQSVGFGQTWQAVTRSLGTTYYNATGRPIVLAAWQNGTGAQELTISINGGSNMMFAIGNPYSSGSVVIPVGASYVLNVPAGTTPSAIWELR